mgnify:CR=1 FL=1
MHNHDIIFDNDNKRIGLVSSNCEMNKGFIDRDDYENDYNGNNYNNNTQISIDDRYTNTCENDILFLRNVCIAVTITMIIIIAILIYIIGELRKTGRFLWLSLNEDIGKYFIFFPYFILIFFLSFFYFSCRIEQ